jgi:hypothetical protein
MCVRQKKDDGRKTKTQDEKDGKVCREIYKNKSGKG